ncbi:hypothetical protein T4D_2302 [Trichinella pseudospiralis]|uniref:Uncharacterized protein n=1 Tax=Trichinella pseudospiralis TaxID=6337 RepID=A0A0V1FU43_TRIPS|nr:hypothetical protein T4D_2302 [Trichinella pseudospiralis]
MTVLLKRRTSQLFPLGTTANHYYTICNSDSTDNAFYFNLAHRLCCHKNDQTYQKIIQLNRDVLVHFIVQTESSKMPFKRGFIGRFSFGGFRFSCISLLRFACVHFLRQICACNLYSALRF